MQEMTNHMRVMFDAKSVNEGLARMVVAAFMAEMNPTMEQLADVKTAVSEAVTNAIVHAYDREDEQVILTCERKNQSLMVVVEDHGVGMNDVEQAKQPFFTTKPEMGRSGMGFAFMEAFMDSMEVESRLGEGTKVTLWKNLAEVGES